jgi:hypothetical protein
MELQKFLIEALKDRFKTNATVEAIEGKIKSIAEHKTFEKYKNVLLFNDGMEFELVGVKAYFFHYKQDIELNNINLDLAFFCKSKLPKQKKEKLEEVKLRYERDKILDGNIYKIPIWKRLSYDVKLENVLSGNINLKID